MTTNNEVVDSLTTQGKGTSQEEAPPQTIIHPELAGTYGKLGPKSDMYDPIISTKVDGGAEGIISPASAEASQGRRLEAIVRMLFSRRTP